MASVCRTDHLTQRLPYNEMPHGHGD